MFKKHVQRLVELDRLKHEVWRHERLAALAGLSRYTDGARADRFQMEQRNIAAVRFNRLRYWWMRRIPMRNVETNQ